MEQQKLIPTKSTVDEAQQRSGEQSDYGALRSYGESDTDRSSDVIYLTIEGKNTHRSDEQDGSHGFTESCVSDPLKRAKLTARRATLSKPYDCLQILIGWHPIVQVAPYQDVRSVCFSSLFRVLNSLYPAVVFILLVLSFFLQYASCYMINIDFDQKENLSAAMEVFCINTEPHHQIRRVPSLTCQQSVLGVYVLPGALNLAFYLYSLALNRYVESEQLPAMIEKVTLQCSSRYFVGYRSQSMMVQSLARFYYLGILWMFAACILPVCFTLSEYIGLHGISFTALYTCSTVNTMLIVLMTLGFIILYLSYTAMLNNYATQTQLMIFLVMGLAERIEDASIEIADTAVSMINDATKLLRVVNGHTASCMSLLIVILGYDAVLFLSSLVTGTLSRLDPFMYTSYVVAVGIAVIFLATSLIQASRLTAACNHLKRLGHEVRTRPLGYHDTSQDALDSFLLYLSTLSMKAKLCRIPISCSLLVPISSVALLMMVLLCELSIFKLS